MCTYSYKETQVQLLFCFVFWQGLCSSGSPETHYIDQAGPNLLPLPPSAGDCATEPRYINIAYIYKHIFKPNSNLSYMPKEKQILTNTGLAHSSLKRPHVVI